MMALGTTQILGDAVAADWAQTVAYLTAAPDSPQRDDILRSMISTVLDETPMEEVCDAWIEAGEPEDPTPAGEDAPLSVRLMTAVREDFVMTTSAEDVAIAAGLSPEPSAHDTIGGGSRVLVTDLGWPYGVVAMPAAPSREVALVEGVRLRDVDAAVWEALAPGLYEVTDWSADDDGGVRSVDTRPVTASEEERPYWM